MSSFLGILPTDEGLVRLRQLERLEVEGIRWEPERRWHLTLRYTRFDDQATLQMMTQVLDEVAREFPPPSVELGPRTERLGRDGTLVLPANGMEALADAVDEALGGALGDRDEPFYGHLTVARLRRNVALSDELLGIPFDATFVAREIVLIESRPSPEGSIYTIRHRRALEGP